MFRLRTIVPACALALLATGASVLALLPVSDAEAACPSVNSYPFTPNCPLPASKLNEVLATLFSAVASGGTPGNPTATAGSAAINGSATTFMRSDGAPAVQIGSDSQFGIFKIDNDTVVAPGGVLSATSPSITVGGSDGQILINDSGGIAGITPGAGITSDLNLTSVTADHTGGNYTILTGDAAKTLLVGAHTYTQPQAGSTGFTTGWGACLVNTSTGVATVNTTTSLFKGASGTTSVTMQPGDWMCPTSDSTNYQTSAGSYRVTIPVAVTYAPGINPNNIPFANFTQARTISGIRCNPEVLAGGAATISVYKAPSGTAISAGTVLHSGSCNANSSATTDQDLTVTVSTLAPGDRLGLVTTGTTVWTSSGVATGVVTVFVR